MSKVFKLRDTPCYDLWHTLQFSTDPILGVYNETESASHLGPKIQEQITAEIKNKEFLDGFNREMKNGNPLNVHVEFVRRLYLIQVLFNKD